MSRREKILSMLNPNLLKITPKLSGGAGAFIDLDSDDSLEDGARKLMMRFFRNQDLCEKNKRNSKQSETEVTISSAEYNDNQEICEIKTEKVTLAFTAEDDEIVDKPGRRLQKLKMELQEKMSAKWEEEYKKRVNESKSYSQLGRKGKKCGDDEEEEEEEDEEKDEEENEEEKYDEGEEADIEFDDDEEEKEEDEDKEEDKEDSNESPIAVNEENNSDEKDDDYNCSLVPAYQPGGGMLYGGSELTQCDDGLPQNLISPSLRLSMNESSASKLSSEFQSNDPTPKKSEPSTKDTFDSFTVKTKLFSQGRSDSFDLNDAFEFCSGKFPDEHSQSASQNEDEENLEGSDEVGENCDDEEELDDDDDEELKEVESEKENSKIRKNIITFDDSEDEEEEKEREILAENQDEPQTGAPVLLSDDEEEKLEEDSKTKKKIRKSLHFSDDEEDAKNNEDDEESEEEEEKDEEEEEEMEKEDFDQRSVHYDSEENEIINPKEFFEKEAELSGSEWSGDEDERGLDRFDVEDGDADEIDQDQVRSQLEKIHIRRVLDDDAREVRLIQEILFEDGDLHSDGKRRDRKFKWKNLGTFDNEGNEGESKENDGNSSEEEGTEENELRKLRLEKELFLMGKKKDGDLSDDEIETFNSVKVTTVKTSLKVTNETSKTVSSTTAISKTLSNTRGSFLARNEEFLSKLAKATSGFTDNILGPKNSKNFVFATKSPEKTNPEKSTACKRQADNFEPTTRRDKKLKLQSIELDTGPSILDLLI